MMFVHLSVCPSGTGVHCDHTVHFSVDLNTGHSDTKTYLLSTYSQPSSGSTVSCPWLHPVHPYPPLFQVKLEKFRVCVHVVFDCDRMLRCICRFSVHCCEEIQNAASARLHWCPVMSVLLAVMSFYIYYIWNWLPVVD